MAWKNDGGSEVTSQNPVAEPIQRSEPTSLILRELVGHLRQHRTQLREDWVSRITRSPIAHGHDQRRGFRRGNFGL